MNEPPKVESDPVDPPEWADRRSPLSRRETLAASVGILLVVGSWMIWWLGHGAAGPVVEVTPATSRPVAQLAINRAEWQELLVVPGVGERTAQRIVEERTANGPFLNLDDLLRRVGRMNRERLDKFAPHLDFSTEPTSGPTERNPPDTPANNRQ